MLALTWRNQPREVIGVVWYGDGWGWAGRFLMTVSTVLVWAVLIAGLVALVRHLTAARHRRPGPSPPSGDGGGGGWRTPGAGNSPAERFARGEIEEDEFGTSARAASGATASPRPRRGVWPAIAVSAAALVLGLASTGLMAASGAFHRPAPAFWRAQSARCGAPAARGSAVDVTVWDAGRMMRGPNRLAPDGSRPGPRGTGMMRLVAHPTTVPAGRTTVRVVNAGTVTHEVVVLPLAPGRAAGERAVGSDGRVSEAGSRGEASRTCGSGAGEGIAPGAAAWTTVTLRPGRYELVCNIPGHYAAGMYAELDVTG
ncbi:sulfocyanin-like copper-binding protein [Streptomyces sp. DSM 118148]|uniref:sulfocyanin-like copper-binding protein n=1 Tax=Streptomyces sp. DSM 118148 TaxID=3448667 RepID=UPI00403FF423